MDMEDIQTFRRNRLAAAATKAGSKAALGRLLGYLDGSLVGQMLRGRRPVSEETVLKLESLSGFADWFASGAVPPSRNGRVGPSGVPIAEKVARHLDRRQKDDTTTVAPRSDP